MTGQDILLGVASVCFALGFAGGLILGLWYRECSSCRKGICAVCGQVHPLGHGCAKGTA